MGTASTTSAVRAQRATKAASTPTHASAPATPASSASRPSADRASSDRPMDVVAGSAVSSIGRVRSPGSSRTSGNPSSRVDRAGRSAPSDWGRAGGGFVSAGSIGKGLSMPAPKRGGRRVPVRSREAVMVAPAACAPIARLRPFRSVWPAFRDIPGGTPAKGPGAVSMGARPHLRCALVSLRWMSQRLQWVGRLGRRSPAVRCGAAGLGRPRRPPPLGDRPTVQPSTRRTRTSEPPGRRRS